MSTLKYGQKETPEKIFEMSNCYVLNFSDRIFAAFFQDFSTDIADFDLDIHTAKICFQVLKVAIADLSGER